MRGILRRVTDAMMGRGPLPRLGRWWNRNRLVVLAYHGIDDRDCFSRHLDHLSSRYNVVSLDQVLASLDGAPLPKYPVLVTFDDGERTVLTDAWPELQARSMPSVVFAVAELIDTDQPFWWCEVETLLNRGAVSAMLGEHRSTERAVAAMKRMTDQDRLDVCAELRDSVEGPPVRQPQLTSDELRRLDASGMAVENHSSTHPLLDQCPDDKVEHEVVGASAVLSEILGRPLRAFAYPNGNNDDRVLEAVRASGAQVAFAFDHRIGRWTPDEPMWVSRVRVNSDCTNSRFAAIVSGVHPACHAIQGRS